jgi:2-keto-4-pentenoate hydratase/2-oxohepta-3-ene-1,7-dioic acid hydratase in catechol pathway
MFSFFKYLTLLLLVLIVGLAGFVFWPALHSPVPAPSACLSLNGDAGKLVPLAVDRDQLYGVALTYPGIIRQGGYDYDPQIPPPIFRKLAPALSMGGEIKYPAKHVILEMIDALEPGLANRLKEKFPALPVLLDYEVELGIVALEDITINQIRDPDFAPKLGYFLANDLQSTTIGILGFGTEREARFLDQKGSFPGFLPVSQRMWVPNLQLPNSLLCIELQTHVNGELRQNQNTKNRIYTNRQILGFVAEAYGRDVIKVGTAIATGSPAGVALNAPRWKKRLGKLLMMDRFDKVSAVASSSDGEGRFLQPGDVIIVHAQPFGSIETTIVK